MSSAAIMALLYDVTWILRVANCSARVGEGPAEDVLAEGGARALRRARRAKPARPPVSSSLSSTVSMPRESRLLAGNVSAAAAWG